MLQLSLYPLVGSGISSLLAQILLVTVGAEPFSTTEITELSGHGHTTDSLSVDTKAIPPVDLLLIRISSSAWRTRPFTRSAHQA